MAVREGSWWSRAWGVVAVVGFALHLGAAVFEAAVIAPLWSLTPPKSVSAWVALSVRPDPSVLFYQLTAVIVVATTMAWLSGIATRGWRRWWLTLALAAAGALVAITVVLMMPCERELFGVATLRDNNAAMVVALTGDWIRAAAFRLAALLVGAWAAYRAQLAGMLADNVSTAYSPRAAAGSIADVFEAGAAVPGSRRAREFAFGDEGEPEISLGDEAANPRERWRGSLRSRRRTAKK